MISSLAKALSKRPVEELHEMLDAARTAAQRSKFEVEVIEEALSSAQDPKRSPAAAAATAPSNGPTPQEIRDMVLRIVGELGPVPPKAIKDAIGDDSINVYNPLSRLVKAGKLTRENGTYAVPASANGQHPSGGPTAAQQTSSHPMYAPEGG
jgi:hypothetical protein